MNDDGPSSGGRFRTVSLGDWLKLARARGVPHVPATEICRLRVRDVLTYDTPGPHQAHLDEAWKTMEAARRPGTMFRWDCCASDRLKHLMAHGRTPANEIEDLQRLEIDMRAYELLSEYPDREIAVWRRPWIRARMQMAGNYPVEYRAFIEAGRVAGISSYYPQRPLRRDDEEIEAVRTLAKRLAAGLTGPLVWPFPVSREGLPEDLEAAGAAGVHATADFAITTDEGAVLLEGGPPRFAGGHPCCFENRPMGGVALEATEAKRGPAGWD